MTQAASSSVGRQIESLFDGGTVAGLSDRQLIDRFNARRDAAGEAAFAALVHRHGPMVLDVCRQLLGDLHHAEDAFQAVFLVLARKAGAIRDPDLLGTWLYGVAVRTARKSRGPPGSPAPVRGERLDEPPGPGSQRLVETTVESAEESAIAREQAAALHDEIDRLPRSFRLPVVLCYFEGLTLDEAARRLHWPAGTVRSRLARARDKLRRGLTRRGVVLPAAAIAAGLSPKPAAASVSSALCDDHDHGRGPLRRRTVRLGHRLGPGPGGAPIHAAPSIGAGRADRARPRRRRAGAGLLGRSLATRGRARRGPGRDRPHPRVERDGASHRPRHHSGDRRLPARSARVQSGRTTVRSRHGVSRSIDRSAKASGSSSSSSAPTAPGPTWTANRNRVPPAWSRSPCSRPARSPTRPRFARRSSSSGGFRPDDLQEHLRDRLADHGLRSRRPRAATSCASSRTSTGWSGPRSSPAIPLSGPDRGATQSRNGEERRQLQHAICLAGPARRQRGRRARQARGLGPGAGLLDAMPEERRELVVHARLARGDRQHDLRGDLQPDHLRTMHAYQGQEFLQGETIRNCGKGRADRACSRASTGCRSISRCARTSAPASSGGSTTSTASNGRAGWRACGSSGRTTGIAWAPRNSSSDQDKLAGFWQGALMENNEILATSFALLFLARGRVPVLINKLRHAPLDDWNLDPDDVRNIVDVVGRDWKSPAHLAGRRLADGHGRPTCGGRRSSSSTGTRRRSSRPPRSRTSGTTSTRAVSSSPTPAAASASSTRASGG